MDAIQLSAVSLFVAIVNALILDRHVDTLLEREFRAEGVTAHEKARHVAVKVAQALVTVVTLLTVLPLVTVSTFQVFSKLALLHQIGISILYGILLAYYLPWLIFGRFYLLHDSSRTLLLASWRPHCWSKNSELNAVLVFISVAQLIISLITYQTEHGLPNPRPAATEQEALPRK